MKVIRKSIALFIVLAMLCSTAVYAAQPNSITLEDDKGNKYTFLINDLANPNNAELRTKFNNWLLGSYTNDAIYMSAPDGTVVKYEQGEGTLSEQLENNDPAPADALENAFIIRDIDDDGNLIVTDKDDNEYIVAPGGEPVPVVPEEVDKADLEALIVTAEAKIAIVKESADGTDISPLETWMTAEEEAALLTAINDAKTVNTNPAATDEDVQAAFNTLTEALAKIKNGTKAADKTDLAALIGTAETKIAAVKNSTDGKDISPSETWMTAEEEAALLTAINDAKTVNTNPAATDEDVQAAFNTLTEALAKIKNGLYVNMAVYNDIVLLAKGKLEASYTSASWTEFQTALAQCNLELTAEAGQTAIDAEVVKIQAAIDKLVVKPQEPDPITIVSVTQINALSYEVVFSAEVGAAGAGTIANYTLGGTAFATVGNPTSVTYNEDTKTATLTRTGGKKGGTVIVTASNLKDSAGNTLAAITGQGAVPKSTYSTLADIKYIAGTNLSAVAGMIPVTLTQSSAQGAGNASAAFNSNTKAYFVSNANIGDDNNAILLTATVTQDPAALAQATIKYKINDGAYKNLNAPVDGGLTFALTDNATTTVTLEVTAQDGVTKEYYTISFIKGISSGSIILIGKGGVASAGVAGNARATGLESGKKYVVENFTAADTKYAKANGTLGNLMTDAAPLTGTEITGLTNGNVYFIRELNREAEIKSFWLYTNQSERDNLTVVTGSVHAGTIDQTAGTITVSVPSTLDVDTFLYGLADVSNGATTSDLDTNYSTPQTITVTSEDGLTTKQYTVSIEFESATALAAPSIIITNPTAINPATLFATVVSAADNYTVTSTQWFVTANGDFAPNPLEAGVSYQARVILRAKQGYFFSSSVNTVTIKTDANTESEEVDAVTVLVSPDGSTLTATITYKATPVEQVAADGTAYTVRTDVPDTSAGLETSQIVLAEGGNAIWAKEDNNAVKEYNANSGALNQQIKALLSSGALVAGDTITVATVASKDVVSVIVKVADTSATLALDKNAIADGISITGKDGKKVTLTGTANNVTLVGDSTGAEFDVNGLTLTAGKKFTSSGTASIITAKYGQEITVDGVTSAVKSTSSTGARVTFANSGKANILDVQFGGDGLTVQQSGSSSLILGGSTTTATIDADTPSTIAAPRTITVTGASLSSGIEVTGVTAQAPANKTLIIKGAVTDTKNLEIQGGDVDVSGASVSGGGVISATTAESKITAGTNAVTIGDASMTLTFLSAGEISTAVNVTELNIAGPVAELSTSSSAVITTLNITNALGELNLTTTATTPITNFYLNSGGSIGTLKLGADETTTLVIGRNDSGTSGVTIGTIITDTNNPILTTGLTIPQYCTVNMLDLSDSDVGAKVIIGGTVNNSKFKTNTTVTGAFITVNTGGSLSTGSGDAIETNSANPTIVINAGAYVNILLAGKSANAGAIEGGLSRVPAASDLRVSGTVSGVSFVTIASLNSSVTLTST